MDTLEKTAITVEATVKAPIEKVWKSWTEPRHITQWCQASDDWHAPYAENDLREGGRFKTTLAAKDGTVSFDFTGIYINVQQKRALDYTIEDGRKVQVTFTSLGDETKIIETFEAEAVNPIEMQRSGWQAILNNFKKYTESTAF